MRDRLYFGINGILTQPGDAWAWTDNMRRWIERFTPWKADSYEYASDAIFRRIFQNSRVRDIAKIFQYFPELDLYPVVHSNGWDLLSRLMLGYQIPLQEIHIFAGAGERDFDLNGINVAMMKGLLQRATVYGSSNDRALKLARNTGKFLNFVGLGYGTLGLDGPKNVAYPDRVRLVFRNNYDHSTWWEPEHFEDTMQLVTKAA